MLENRDEILSEYQTIIQSLIDTSELDKKSANLQSECEVVEELLRKCVKENAHSTLDQVEYQRRYTALIERYEADRKGLAEIDNKRLERKAKRENIDAFFRILEKSDSLLSKFDEGLWNAIIEKMIVHSEYEITFIFKNGMKLDCKI